MLFDTQHVTVGQTFAKLAKCRAFGVLGFRFGLVQVTYLRPPLKTQAQVHAFWNPTRHCRPKIGNNWLIFRFYGFRVLFWFG